MTASILSAGDPNMNLLGDSCCNTCEGSTIFGASSVVTPIIKIIGILTTHSLQKETGPQKIYLSVY